MNLADKNKYKSDFKKELDTFSDKLEKYVSTDNGDWTVKGFIDVYKNIYTISSDTKIVSKILEIHIFPQILQFAESIGYKIILAEKQNWYPDLTFIHKKNDEVKFALDIKTTFRRNDKTAGFTLGSHGGYFKERDKDKNLKSITSVIKDFDCFSAEKWKISSDKQGSGKTANIGSIVNIDDLRNGNGIFSQLGEEWFDEYWINYGSATMVKGGKPVKITTLKDFLEFKGRTDLLEKIVTRAKKSKAISVKSVSKKVSAKKSAKKKKK